MHFVSIKQKNKLNCKYKIMKKDLSFFAIVCAIVLMGMFQGCKKATIPELTTVTLSEVGLTSAVSGGTIITDGGEDITAKGVCWSTSANPTIEGDFKTSDGAGSANFTSNIVGLSEGTTYYVRAYATNEVGTAYGNELSFTTNEVTGAVLTTAEPSALTSESVVVGGNITSDGGGNITARGVYWGTSPNPTENKTNDGAGSGVFSSNLTGLSDGTVYYYRAYATNSSGTTYGQELSFITPVTDIEGNVYKTVKIGDQVWMAENLKSTKYNDEAPIPNVTSSDEWKVLGTPAFSWAGNDEATSKPLYGALYNWFVVGTGKLCPTGWHVPTDVDFINLELALGLPQEDINVWDWRGTDQGQKMKSTTGWLTNENGTNSSGFTALPSGFRYYGTGGFEGQGTICYLWSSSEPQNLATAYYRRLDGDENRIYKSATLKQAGKAIRCIKD